MYEERNVPSLLGTGAKIVGITAGFVFLGPLLWPGLLTVYGVTAARGTKMTGVYADCRCLVVRGVKFADGRYQFYFAAQEKMDPKTGEIKSTTTFVVRCAGP